MKQSYKEVVIATKVTPEVKDIIEEVGHRLGISIYELLNLMIHCVVKYADAAHQLDPNLQKIIDIFEDFAGWEYMSAISSRQGKIISKAAYLRGKRNFAIYFFRELKKQRAYAVMVDAEKYPKEATYNVIEIFQYTLAACFPKLARLMDKKCKARGYDNYYELLKDIIYNSEDIDINERFINTLFEEDNYDTFGNKIEVHQYVQHKHKSPYTEDRRVRPSKPIADAVAKAIPLDQSEEDRSRPVQTEIDFEDNE